MYSDYLDVFEKLHLEGSKWLSWRSLMKASSGDDEWQAVGSRDGGSAQVNFVSG